MLDAYIIEQIRRRQEERNRIYERPALELELPLYREPPRADDEDEDEAEEAPRVIVIDL